MGFMGCIVTENFILPDSKQWVQCTGRPCNVRILRSNRNGRVRWRARYQVCMDAISSSNTDCDRNSDLHYNTIKYLSREEAQQAVDVETLQKTLPTSLRETIDDLCFSFALFAMMCICMCTRKKENIDPLETTTETSSLMSRLITTRKKQQYSPKTHVPVPENHLKLKNYS